MGKLSEANFSNVYKIWSIEAFSVLFCCTGHIFCLFEFYKTSVKITSSGSVTAFRQDWVKNWKKCTILLTAAFLANLESNISNNNSSMFQKNRIRLGIIFKVLRGLEVPFYDVIIEKLGKFRVKNNQKLIFGYVWIANSYNLRFGDLLGQRTQPVCQIYILDSI